MNAPSTFHATKMARLARLHLRTEDFAEKFSRASGPGGQHVNKVSTAVTLRHVPSGLTVTAQDSRSQALNRQLAWLRLLDLIEATRHAASAAKKAAREKERRRNAPRPRGVKERMLASKKHRSQVKKLRAREW
jgi:protein subunit release factor B